MSAIDRLSSPAMLQDIRPRAFACCRCCKSGANGPALSLSARLGVDKRTIRRDVDRLRELGYVIDASAGPGGGYRLGAGTATPPLLLDDDEAVAVAVALGAVAGNMRQTPMT